MENVLPAESLPAAQKRQVVKENSKTKNTTFASLLCIPPPPNERLNVKYDGVQLDFFQTLIQN